MMTIPEETIIKQGEEDPGCCMFIIIQGDCDIKMLCNDNSFNYGDNLIKGEHFGEIRLINNCPRTSNVIGRSYNIIGLLDQDNYKNICRLYPKFNEEVKNYMWTYQDPIKNFFHTCLQKLVYF